MSALRTMTVRELILELSLVEDAIRDSRLPLPTDSPRTADLDREHLADLAVQEYEIVGELHRRRGAK